MLKDFDLNPTNDPSLYKTSCIDSTVNLLKSYWIEDI